MKLILSLLLVFGLVASTLAAPALEEAVEDIEQDPQEKEFNVEELLKEHDDKENDKGKGRPDHLECPCARYTRNKKTGKIGICLAKVCRKTEECTFSCNKPLRPKCQDGFCLDRICTPLKCKTERLVYVSAEIKGDEKN